MILIYKIILIAILLFLSGFFSASEVALFSLNPIRLKRLQRQGKDTIVVANLISKPSRLLVTILIGNGLVNVWASSLVSSMTIEAFGDKFLPLSILTMTLLLLFFGEVTPKTIAIYNAEKIAFFVAKPLKYFATSIFPLRYIFRNIADKLIKAFGVEEIEEPLLTEDEFKTIIDVGHRRGVVDKTERDMILSVLEFTEMRLKQIMVPRVDIKAVKNDISREAFIEFARKVKHSKIPVYENTVDKITGVLYAKEVFSSKDKPLSELVRPILFVPGSKKIVELLKNFNEGPTKIAVVLDEFGGTDGIVTFEDILEEIFGEIYDEFETPEELIIKLSEDKFKISAKTKLEDVNKITGSNFHSKEHGNLAAFVLALFGKIPYLGEHIDHKIWRFTIDSMAAKRIISVIMERK